MPATTLHSHSTAHVLTPECLHRPLTAGSLPIDSKSASRTERLSFAASTTMKRGCVQACSDPTSSRAETAPHWSRQPCRLAEIERLTTSQKPRRESPVIMKRRSGVSSVVYSRLLPAAAMLLVLVSNCGYGLDLHQFTSKLVYPRSKPLKGGVHI